MALNATEQAAFVGQITRHQAMLKAFIISLMPGIDGVDDVLQQTNLVLWEKRESFRPGSNFRAWACMVARLEVKSHRRRMIRQGKLLLSEDLSEMLAEHSEASPSEIDERQAALARCLDRLGESERELIDHRYFSGGTLDEFAASCGRTAESLRVTLFRIRAALRKCINGEIAVNRARL